MTPVPTPAELMREIAGSCFYDGELKASLLTDMLTTWSAQLKAQAREEAQCDCCCPPPPMTQEEVEQALNDMSGISDAMLGAAQGRVE